MALWVARDFGKNNQPQWLESKESWFGGIVGSHGRPQRKWCESFQSEAQQRSTGLKKEHFICGLWSSLQRLSLAYLALPCPLLSLVSLCYLTIVTLWYSLLSCSQLLYYHPPDIVQSCCVIINLPVPASVKNHAGSLTVDLRDKSITMRVVVFWDSWRPSSELSRVLTLLSRRRRCTWVPHTRDRKQVRSTRGVKCYITTANGKKRNYLQKKWDLQV